MEKRFAVFLVLSALILFLHLTIQGLLHPPQPPPLDEFQQQPLVDDPAPDVQLGEERDPPPEVRPEPIVEEPIVEAPALEPPPEVDVAPEYITLGSLAADSPYRLLVTLTNRGAAIERIEMSQRTPAGRYRYRQLDRPQGYLGHLALVDVDEPAGGARVQVVGPGTPAALARPEEESDVPPGLEPGDVVMQLDGRQIQDARDVRDFLKIREPGQTVRVTVQREGQDAANRELTFVLTLTDEPLSLIQPEYNPHADTDRPDQLSFLLTMLQVGDRAVERGRDEISGLRSLREGLWEVESFEDDHGPGVEFSTRLTPGALDQIGVEGDLQLVKRYRLAAVPDEQRTDWDSAAYHLDMEIVVRNLGEAAQQVAYRLDGANGLPLEGWWYSNKTHPRRFAGVGARDVVWRTPKAGHNLVGAPEIYKEAKAAQERQERDTLPTIPLFPVGEQQLVEYIGVDSQYFSVVLIPDRQEDPRLAVFEAAMAMPAGPVGEKRSQWVKTTNATFRLDSPARSLEPGEELTQRFTIFAGPKRPALLSQYALDDVITYGWFWMIARPLSRVLHFFAWLTLGSYGLAIILLTVLVRSAMTPLSRKAARNAQMMQELAPEMKRIAEKYKNDMEKRAAAQRELFAKHNYNPFGGCLLMFVQLPIFIGLYRALSVDIELLQAPLIPGLRWASNLAGPDMLFYWESYLPAILGDPGSGWLGPYFNILPIITIFLFLLQQKLFMPPATDDQTRMQHQMMKFMMIFMGVLFFRVPSGLCVYFIASSMWGIAERKMLPPPTKPGAAGTSPAPRAPTRREEQAQAESEAKKARIKKRPKKR